MERHKCKLCSRTFGSGRALGGHMKAHLATIKPKQQPFTTRFASSFSSYSSSSESEHEVEEEKAALIYVLRENPKKSIRIADPQFSSFVALPDNTAAGSVVVQDRESETESKKPTRQRSKRNRKSSFNVMVGTGSHNNQNFVPKKKQRFMVSTPPTAEAEPVSSVSDTSPDEDVAMCLMMLSRDKWRKRNNVGEEEEGKEGWVEKTKMKMKRVRGKHVCENCGKAFRSSKALGSHTSVCCVDEEGNVNNDKNKIFECPFCYKVFGSGQALGGHKRSHLFPPSSSSTVAAIAIANSSSATILKFKENCSIDLNLPAPLEDDDLSVLSDA